MGRHSTGRLRIGLNSPVVLLAILLVVALVGWLTYAFLRNQLSAEGCDNPVKLSIVAAPDIAPVVSQTAKDVSAQDGDGCYDVNVTARDSEQTAQSLALSSDGTAPPDVWVPESTMWLQRAREAGSWSGPATGTSIASSPVVFGLTEDAAARLGWPGKTPTWTSVLAADPKNLQVGMADPAHDPSGLSALFAVKQYANKQADAGAAYTSTLRKLSANSVDTITTAYDRLPGGSNADQPLLGFPTSENALLRYNVRQPRNPLVGVYAEPPIPSLDYPYVVLPTTAQDHREVAERFLARLLEPITARAFGEAGFRTPDGRMLRDRSNDDRVTMRTMAPTPLPATDVVDSMLTEWSGVNLSARILVLLDVSGSMTTPVGDTGKSRMDVTVDAAKLGIGLFKPTTKVGLWLFSTNLDGPKDYKELLPVETVQQLRDSGGLSKLDAVKKAPRGATGLYDTVLAGYQNARANWEPGKINVVVVMTDGKNEDAHGISRQDLLGQLAKLQDPRRPIPVIGIGIGPDIDVDELQTISKATGGQAFTTPDPTKITNVFYAALSKLLCQPPQCKPQGGS
ncbi:substrate-binding and VWA domain-containing protein [Labedaea rhizosphaerae]|uniref:von Willebrand factor type A domain-containing protein n=1 Tax=Labedaea rhizosphaerae TaxID=598644 RepID=A0A4R6SK71_LABRH|nr:substrate-binding and VWA domain-containing protein [Labedaea rhizosphaerae]TDQ04469.1 von Willebrand factor type A domain-containing protein [Labedaea rhizosphaerae]